MRIALRSTALFLLVVGIAVLIVGCGGTTATTTSTTSPVVTTTPTTGLSVSTSGNQRTTTSTAPPSSAATGAPGSKGNPIPFQTAATVGAWKIKLTSADLKADSTLKSAPAYQAPDPGSQYVLIRLDATYSGEQPDSFSNGLGYQIIGNRGDTFNAVDLGLDNSIEGTSAAVQGGSVSGSLVFSVPSDQLSGATLWIAPSSAGQETGVYFALK
jgi:hypothetical protein